MKQSSRPNQEHAYSRYFRFTDDALDRLQQDYLAGRDLGRSIPGISATEAAVIVAESLEADELWATLPQRLLEGAPPAPRGKPLSDWSRAVMAELFFAVVDQARAQGNKKQERNAWALAWAALEEVTKSPDASPMLWYEGLFFDVSQQLRMTGERKALELLKQALAHNLRYNDGDSAVPILRDLAETYLWLDDLDEGLVMLAALLRNDPADVWTYNLMAITFDRFGLAEVGAEAARRGLELVEATGDPERLRQQLLDALERLQKSERRGREAKVDAAVLAELRAALAPGLNAGEGRPIVELCRELVPDLEQVPVKRPAGKPDLPPPGEGAGRQERPPAGRKPRRNEPCWCGSGKKYKHCHLRLDRGGRT